MTKIVRNEWGAELDFDAVTKLMDAEIKEDLKTRISPFDEQWFFDAYCEDHYLKFGCEFEPERVNLQCEERAIEMHDLCKQQIEPTVNCTHIIRYLDNEPFEDHGVNYVRIDYYINCCYDLNRIDHIFIYVDFDNEDGSVSIDMDLDVLVNPITEKLEIDQGDCRRLADRMDAKGIYFLFEDSEEFSDFINFAIRCY